MVHRPLHAYVRLVQRLFLMFPDGAPGVALVLLRAVVGTHLWGLRHVLGVTLQDEKTVMALASIPIAALVIGACTPLVAAGAALLGASVMIATLDPALVPMVMSSVVLLLLGPGAYSIDARRFGRRRWAGARGTAPDE